MPKKPLRPLDPKKPLTLKQQKFVAAYLKTGHQTNSALAAGYSSRSAHPIAAENLQKPAIQAAIASCLEKAGLTDELIAKKIREGSDANETRFFSRDGIVTDEREVVAWETRKNYIELAAKLKGHLQRQEAEQVMSPGVIINMRFNLNPPPDSDGSIVVEPEGCEVVDAK